MFALTQSWVLMAFGLVLLVLSGVGCIAYLLHSDPPQAALHLNLVLMLSGSIAALSGRAICELERRVEELKRSTS